MAKKLLTIKQMVVVEYSKTEQNDNGGYQFGVFTKDEWKQGSGLRYSEMDFDSIQSAQEFALNY